SSGPAGRRTLDRRPRVRRGRRDTPERRARMLLVLFLMSLAGEPPAPAQPPFSPAAARGADAARTRCGSCHAVGRDDASPNPAAPPLREIRGRYPVEALEEAFAEGVVVGHDTPMPSFVLTP